MAIFNEPETTRIARMLQKFFGIKGGAPVRQVAGEIAPALQIFSGCENRYLENWQRYGHAVGNTSGAAQFVGHQWRNPGTSTVVAVIEKIVVFGTGTADRVGLFIGPATTDLTTVVSTAADRFDGRGQQAPTLIVSSTANFGAGPAHFQGEGAYQANTAYDFIQNENQELTIVPGDALQLFDVVANLTMNAAVWWRERVLEESERT